ncbi:MAG TPA: hypothetical protein VLW75_12155 [Rhizomicrobium sp.]|nr:hypothetical protein [Rhizomicrobium sp.]
MNKAAMKKIVLSFPSVEEGSSHGKPAFLLNKKFFTRLRASDNAMVLLVDTIDERDMLLEAEPKLFFITEHYKNYPSVLARLSKLDVITLRSLLQRRWQKIAPKKLQAVIPGERRKAARGKGTQVSKSKKR